MLDALPQRVRVVVLGTDLHGLAVAYDLLSRGWSDIILIDPNPKALSEQPEPGRFQLESLFSLFNFRDFRHLPKALQELFHLQILAQAGSFQKVCHFSSSNLSRADVWFYRGGILLFRRLTKSVRSHAKLVPDAAQALATDRLSFIDEYVCWHHLRCGLYALLSKNRPQIVTGAKSLTLKRISDGFRLSFLSEEGRQELSALYVINALGTDANRFLAESRLPVMWPAVNREFRTELYRFMRPQTMSQAWILPRHGNREAMQIVPLGDGQVLLSMEQKRWRAAGDRGPDEDQATMAALAESLGLLQLQNLEFVRADRHHFSVPYESQKHFGSLRNASPFIMSEHRSGRGLLLTMYNLKAMTHRAFAEEVGDRLMRQFGEVRQSQTRLVRA